MPPDSAMLAELVDASDIPSSRPQFPWCAECGEMLQYQKSGGSCPNGHGRIYPARTAGEWMRYARYGWIMGLPEVVWNRRLVTKLPRYAVVGGYQVVGDGFECWAGVALQKAKSTDAKWTFDLGKPADFERSREGRFVVRQAKRKRVDGEWQVVGWRPLVVEPMDEELRSKAGVAG